MARQTAKSLKAKKQISEYTSQAIYSQYQNGFQMYRVVKKLSGEVVGTGVTMKQFIRQFHPLSQYKLEPE
jgi:predicted nucleic acid-binding protein